MSKNSIFSLKAFYAWSAFFLFLLASPPVSVAQLNDVPDVTRTFAIENARIVQAPGRVIERGVVVVRDGQIVDVGANVAVPFDAERIAGDSLTVYAGFIDGLSHAGIPAPKQEANSGSPFGGGQNRPRVNRANPTNERAGIQPERSAIELIDPKDASIASLREAGFTVAHVVPRGQMLPGSGAIVSLAGEKAGEMVLQQDVSMFAQIEGARGVYPATPMGVMAKMRQLYREAERRKKMEAQYASNEQGAARPEYDAVHYAFFDVVDGERPIFMYADDALTVYRALRLKNSLGYPLMLGGLAQGFESLDVLLDADVPLFLTLKLPEEPKKDDASKSDSTQTDEVKADTVKTEMEELPAYDPSLHVTDHTSTKVEKTNLEARRRIFRDEFIATAATFYDAGLDFGFTTKDVKATDIHKNLRMMVEKGLPEEAALAALTTTPAQTLGLSQRMGTVDTGKLANLVVATGPLFDKGTKIKYVFVDGQKFENDLKKKPEGGNAGRRGTRPDME